MIAPRQPSRFPLGPLQPSDPQLREIRQLQNKLDKTLVKYNESQQVRLTYEQIVKRLKEERIGCVRPRQRGSRRRPATRPPPGLCRRS